MELPSRLSSLIFQHLIGLLMLVVLCGSWYDRFSVRGAFAAPKPWPVAILPEAEHNGANRYAHTQFVSCSILWIPHVSEERQVIAAQAT